MYFLLFEMRENVSRPLVPEYTTAETMHCAALKRQTWRNATVLLHISNGLFILLRSCNNQGYGQANYKKMARTERAILIIGWGTRIRT
jgi:hypothetical protein